MNFNRTPNFDEIELSQSIVQQGGLFALCHVLLNANEFVYLD